MRVFVTGLKGFLGSHLARFLHEKGCVVGGLDMPRPETKCWGLIAGDLPDVKVTKGYVETDAEESMRPFKPDVVVHLAARAIVEDGYRDPVPTYMTDVMGTVGVLEACRKLKIPAVVATTDKVYGRSRPPFIEEDTRFRPFTPYDTSKACADIIARSYADAYGVRLAIVRSCNIYGPGDLHWSRLVPRTFRNLARDERPVLYHSMQNVRREWVHVADECAAFWALIEGLLENPAVVAGLAYNISTGAVLTNKEMVRQCVVTSGKKGVTPILSEKDFPEIGDMWLAKHNINRVGWEPKVPLEDGLRETWQWYKEYCGGKT